VSKDHRIVDALLPAQQIIIDGHVHGAGYRLKQNFRLVASVVGWVDGQRIGRVCQRGPAGAIKIEVASAVTSGQKVRPVVGEIRDIPVGRIDGDGNNAVRQDHVRAVGGNRDIGPGASAAAGDVGLGNGRR
jgi:hypothetical protein